MTQSFSFAAFLHYWYIPSLTMHTGYESKGWRRDIATSTTTNSCPTLHRVARGVQCEYEDEQRLGEFALCVDALMEDVVARKFLSIETSSDVLSRQKEGLACPKVCAMYWLSPLVSSTKIALNSCLIDPFFFSSFLRWISTISCEYLNAFNNLPTSP